MLQLGPVRSRYGLERHGIENVARVWWNLPVPALYEEAIRRGEGLLTQGGALVATTGKHTGRSPEDKYVVHEPTSADRIWWGTVNRPLQEAHFDRLYQRLLDHLQGRE